MAFSSSFEQEVRSGNRCGSGSSLDCGEMGGFTSEGGLLLLLLLLCRRAFVMELLGEMRIVQQANRSGGGGEYVLMLEVNYDRLLTRQTHHSNLQAQRHGIHEQHALRPSLAVGQS